MNMKSSLFVLLLTAIVAHTTNGPTRNEWDITLNEWETPGYDAEYVVEAYEAGKGGGGGVKVSINQMVFAASETENLQSLSSDPTAFFSVDSFEFAPIKGTIPANALVPYNNYIRTLLKVAKEKYEHGQYCPDQDLQSMHIYDPSRHKSSTYPVSAAMKVKYNTDHDTVTFKLFVDSCRVLLFDLVLKVVLIDETHSQPHIRLGKIRTGNSQYSTFSSLPSNTFASSATENHREQQPSNAILTGFVEGAKAIRKQEDGEFKAIQQKADEEVKAIQSNANEVVNPTAKTQDAVTPKQAEIQIIQLADWDTFFQSITAPESKKTGDFRFTANDSQIEGCGIQLAIRGAIVRPGTDPAIFDVPSYKISMIGNQQNTSTFNEFIGNTNDRKPIILESDASIAGMSVEYPIRSREQVDGPEFSAARFIFGPKTKEWTITITMIFDNGEKPSIEMEKVKFSAEDGKATMLMVKESDIKE